MKNILFSLILITSFPSHCADADDYAQQIAQRSNACKTDFENKLRPSLPAKIRHDIEDDLLVLERMKEIAAQGPDKAKCDDMNNDITAMQQEVQREINQHPQPNQPSWQDQSYVKVTQLTHNLRTIHSKEKFPEDKKKEVAEYIELLEEAQYDLLEGQQLNRQDINELFQELEVAKVDEKIQNTLNTEFK